MKSLEHLANHPLIMELKIKQYRPQDEGRKDYFNLFFKYQLLYNFSIFFPFTFGACALLVP